MKKAIMQIIRFLIFLILTCIKPFAFVVTVIAIGGASFMRLFSSIMGAQELISIQAMCITIFVANAFYFGLNYAIELLRPRVD